MEWLLKRFKLILITFIMIAMVGAIGYYVYVKSEKRYIFFVVDAMYKKTQKTFYAHRYFVSNVCEIHWSNSIEEKDRLQDKAMFQIRERVKSMPECEYIVEVTAPNYVEKSYESASDKMYESLRARENYYAQYGDGMTETFNINQ